MVGYTPKRPEYQIWVNTKSPSREYVANCLRLIRKHDGRAEAMAFLNWLCWLGTYPVRTNLNRMAGK